MNKILIFIFGFFTGVVLCNSFNKIESQDIYLMNPVKVIGVEELESPMDFSIYKIDENVYFSDSIGKYTIGDTIKFN